MLNLFFIHHIHHVELCHPVGRVQPLLMLGTTIVQGGTGGPCKVNLTELTLKRAQQTLLQAEFSATMQPFFLWELPSLVRQHLQQPFPVLLAVIVSVGKHLAG